MEVIDYFDTEETQKHEDSEWEAVAHRNTVLIMEETENHVWRSGGCQDIQSDCAAEPDPTEPHVSWQKSHYSLLQSFCSFCHKKPEKRNRDREVTHCDINTHTHTHTHRQVILCCVLIIDAGRFNWCVLNNAATVVLFTVATPQRHTSAACVCMLLCVCVCVCVCEHEYSLALVVNLSSVC